jgi:SAM-dependent methyltransferase
MTEGVNLGSGNWVFRNWKAIDSLRGQELNETSVFEFEDSSVLYAYSCHFFEHINDATAQQLFDEVYRILKPGGIFRIIVPDFYKVIDKYKKNDEVWFKSCGFSSRPEWKKYEVPNNLQSLMLHIISNFDYNGPKGFYRGGPIGLDSKVVNEKVNNMPWDMFTEWAQTQHPEEKIKRQHINWWNLDKFQSMMPHFNEVKKCEFGESKIPHVANTGLFDKEKPGRKLFSLYIEATKLK